MVQVRSEALLNWNVETATAEVFVVNGDKARSARSTGRRPATTVEVQPGLQPGDQVVTRGGFALRHGDRVT